MSYMSVLHQDKQEEMENEGPMPEQTITDNIKERLQANMRMSMDLLNIIDEYHELIERHARELKFINEKLKGNMRSMTSIIKSKAELIDLSVPF